MFYFFKLYALLIATTLFTTSKAISLEEYRWKQDLASARKIIQKKIEFNAQKSQKDILDANKTMGQLEAVIESIEEKINNFFCEDSEENRPSANNNNNQKIISLASAFTPKIPQWIRNALETSSDIIIIHFDENFYVVGSQPNILFKLNTGDHNMVLTKENKAEELVGYDKNFRIFRRFAQGVQ